ncbi:MAG: cytochrome c biogenesis protein [Ktedonobacterales bacterium]
MQITHARRTEATGARPGSRWPSWLAPAARYGEYALGAATVVTLLLSIWMAFGYAPTDYAYSPTNIALDEVQRIEYFHVPIAWVAYLAFFVVAVAGILYLWRKDERWDWLARASAEIGTVFTTLVLITGSLWGRGALGWWWVWDARLTTSLLLWFVYAGYLLLRSYTGRSESGARAAAVLGIVAFVGVPINYLSVTWWNTQHPPREVLGGGSNQSPPQVVITVLVCLLAFTLLFCFLLLQAYRLQRMQSQALGLRARAELAALDEG